MQCEIITIGDEICRGEIVDTNRSWLAAELWDLDVTVTWMTSCRDRREDIRRALEIASGRADLVLASGGLGPTEDDLTVDVVSEIAGVEPTVHEPSLERMVERFHAIGYELTPHNMRQVRVPAGSRVYPNPAGMAPGFEIDLGTASALFVPGFPRELEGLFESAVRARVTELRDGESGGAERVARRIYRVFGKGESQVAAALDGVTGGVPGASLHFQVKFPEVLVKVVVRDRDPEAASARLEALDGAVRSRVGRRLYGTDGDTLPDVLGRALTARGLTLATAESCTGGLVGALVTRTPGSSAYFLGGAVTYSNAEKVRQLGVTEATLEAEGAVSEATVVEMARGARQRLHTDLAVAVSGVAGPGGGTADKPVGLVWVAVAGPDGEQTRQLTWPGAREQIRTVAAYWALMLVLEAAGEVGDG